MANSELYGKTYNVPPDVLRYIQTILVSNPTGKGVRRAKFILKNGILTYQELKGLKNFFDTFNFETEDKAQYELAGGNLMKAFIDNKLNAERAATDRSAEVNRDANVDVNLGTKPYSASPELNEAKKDLKKNAVAVIVNNDNKILLLKRAEGKDMWMPGKWALVGGAIEKSENPKEAIKREIKEETGLDVDKFIKTFSIQRHPDSTEHVFACRYSGESTDIVLNDENTNYGWYDVEEMKFLDIVPHLIEYITLTFKKYE